MLFLLALSLFSFSPPSALAAEGSYDCQFQVEHSKPVPRDQKRRYVTHIYVAPNEGPLSFGFHKEGGEEEALLDGGWIFAGIVPLSAAEIRKFLASPAPLPESPSRRSYSKLADRDLLRLQERQPMKADYVVQVHYNFGAPSTLTIAREINWVGEDDGIQMGFHQPWVKKQKIALLPDAVNQPIQALGLAGSCRFVPQP